jgi:hypothetical protein
MAGRFVRLLVVTSLGFCSLGTVAAQTATDKKELIGNWVYRLGPNSLFGLHLEPDPGEPGRLRGYLLHPEHFNFNSVNSSLLRFSEITNQSQRESLISVGWQNGVLQLKDASSAKSEDGVIYLVHLADVTDIDLTLSSFVPPLKMERTTAEPRLADNWDSTRTYSPDDSIPDDPQMAQIAAADKADRKDSLHADWLKVRSSDSERRIATASLLREGKLHTGHDFESAALIFQHGATSDDFLLAHVLAMVAISKGQTGAVWISAATLDRYLQSIYQPQILGTQFATPDKQPTTQEPYNRSLVSDSLRGYMGVPDQAAQEAQRHQYDLQHGIGPAPPQSTSH